MSISTTHIPALARYKWEIISCSSDTFKLQQSWCFSSSSPPLSLSHPSLSPPLVHKYPGLPQPVLGLSWDVSRGAVFIQCQVFEDSPIFMRCPAFGGAYLWWPRQELVLRQGVGHAHDSLVADHIPVPYMQ